MSRKSFYAVALIAALVLVLGALPAAAQEKAVVTWFVGLGTGTQAEQIEVQNQVVADFNASQDEVELVINIAASNETARDTLSTLIAAGTPPDIVGPVGVGGSNAYVEQWADLTPLVEASGFDLSIFDPALVDLYRTADGQLLGIPFATFPSILYFNRGLFDEAGLEYPPQEFGAPYVLDGEEVPWNYETVREIAKILTVDAAGNDATSADFDPANIVQFGLNFQWARTRLIWTDLQPEVFYDFETGTATIPESWRTATQWWRDLVWEDHSIPTTAYDGSELLATGNAFSSGNLAMAVTPLWYTCCLDNSVGNFEWDLAVVPQSLDGEYHVATDADTFRLLKGSANPEAAFKALSYLLTDAVPSLTAVYGAFPAHPAYQQADIDKKTERYPWDINWQVAVDSLAYNNPGPVHHEADFPNWQKGHDRIDAFQNLLLGETGAEIDVAAELDKLEADVNAIIDEVTG
jgi:multiple sugar transport system substrate-binding protein